MTLEQIIKKLEKKGYIVKTIFPILPNSFGFNEDFEFTTEDFSNIKWNGYNWLVVIDRKTDEYFGTSYLQAYKDILNLKVEG